MYDATNDPIYLEYATLFRGYEKNSDVYTAAGSINEISHGPSQAKALYQSAYWSHSRFPTWLRIDFGRVEKVRGFQLDSVKSGIPKSFSLKAMVDGQWRTVSEASNNKEDTVLIEFEPVRASSFRLDITESNEKLVALQAAMPIRVHPRQAMVTNHCNWRTGALESIEDDSVSTSMKVLCPGFLLVPVDGASSVSIYAEGARGTRMRFSESDDLYRWTPATEIELVSHVQPKLRWLKVEFSDGVQSINQIRRD